MRRKQVVKQKSDPRDVMLLVHTAIFCFSFMSFVCFAMPVANLIATSGEVYEISGLLAVFGGKMEFDGTTLNFNFSGIILASYLLALVNSVVSIFAYRTKKVFMYVITMALSVAVTVLYFLEFVLFKANNSLVWSMTELANTTLNVSFGPFLAAGCGIITIISIVIGIVFNRKFFKR